MNPDSRWTILRVTSSGRAGTKVLARCECGTEREILRYRILNRVSLSCGCLHREVTASRHAGQIRGMIGRRFGRWVVLERSGSTPSGQAEFKCRCDCGKEARVAGRSLRTGGSLSCGCLRQERSVAANTKALVGYYSMHDRLRARFGPASAMSCIDCDQPAREWSYMGGAPDERVDDGLAYSLQVEFYAPRCVRCHRKHDGAQRRVAAA